MKITTKGRFTIPAAIRKRLGIYPGANVEFKLDGNVLRVIPTKPPAKRDVSLSEFMRGSGTIKMSTDEIMAITRGEI